MKISLFLIILLSALFENLQGQNENGKLVISGTVIDSAGIPVEGAVIFVDNINSGRKTNKKGLFKISVSSNPSTIGVFTHFSGMTDVEVNNNKTINVRLPVCQQETSIVEQDRIHEEIEEYKRSSNKNNKTPKSNRLERDENKNARYATIYEMLNGTVPGVNVIGKSITIRGQSSFYGPSEPLFVVDGIIMSSIDNILPTEVRSIEVIKSSSAAIYGFRGSNGVIVIKTLKSVSK